MKYLVLLLIFHFVFSINGELLKDEAKKRRSFSIFSVVQFQNNVCYLATTSTSTTPTRGTCYTSSECSSNGGSGTGSCASGFGVCCVFTVSTCGTTVSKNTTYIQNPGFPSAFTTVTTSCAYTISSTSDICQIRLDFDNLVLAPPGTAAVGTIGVCALTDRITFASPAGTGTSGAPPVLCGTLTGTHMYIETGRQSPTGATITIANAGTAASTPARTWKIRVTQIECGNPARAPTDCLQYYTGPAGSFTSYNFQGGSGGALSNGQNYNICFRQEEGYCSIQYSLADVTAPAVAFSVDNSITTASRQGGTTCAIAEITIPSSFLHVATTASMPATVASNGDTFCGVYFNEQNSQIRNGAIVSNITPFVVGVYTLTGATATTAVPSLGVGFHLNYNQIPC